MTTALHALPVHRTRPNPWSLCPVDPDHCGPWTDLYPADLLEFWESVGASMDPEGEGDYVQHVLLGIAQDHPWVYDIINHPEADLDFWLGELSFRVQTVYTVEGI